VYRRLGGTKRGTARAGNFIIFYEKRNKNHQLGRGLIVHDRIVSVVKREEVISDGMSYF
jgi:hypothetical protein